MRILIRILVALGVLAAVAVAALAVMLPRLVQSDEVRGRISEAAREATGREFAYGELDVGIVPPRLEITQASLAGDAAAAEPMLEGADVQLRLALLPLLARTIVVDSLVVSGATVRLVRTPEGIELPEPEAEAAAEAAPETDEPGVSLAVRRIDLRDMRVVLEDRAVSPPVTWDLRELAAKVRGRSLEEPLDVELSAVLASGGRFELTGKVTPGGSLDLALALEDVDLAPAAPYLGDKRSASGRLSGKLTARGESAEDPAIVLDLRLADGEVVLDDLTLVGGVHIEADLDRLATPRGRFALDATDSALRYGGAFQKPAGTTATVEGRVSTGEDGAIVIEDTRVRIKNLDAKARIETGARTRLQLDADPFELDGWQDLLPALADSPPRGRVGFDGLAVRTEPLEVRGRILLDDLRLPQAAGQSERGELVLKGALVGEGKAVTSEALVARFAGQELALDLRITDLARTPKLALRTALEDADSNALLTTLANKPDTLSGPLDVNADLSLPLGGDTDPVEAIAGSLRFSIDPGRLKGVSLLRSTFERFGSFGEAAVLVGQVKGGKTLQRFYDDEFQSLSGTFQLARGRARSNDLRFVYRHYSVDLRGSLGLTDQTLDFTGTLTMDEEIDAALAGAETGGQQPASIPEGGATRGKSRSLPLARVVGTLDAPKVQLTREAVVAFATRGGSIGRKRDKISEKIDDALGKGSGDQVLDVLEGILGGRKR